MIDNTITKFQRAMICILINAHHAFTSTYIDAVKFPYGWATWIKNASLCQHDDAR